MTTEQYLAQIWPATGAEVMQLVAEAMRNTGYQASDESLELLRSICDTERHGFVCCRFRFSCIYHIHG